MKTIILAAVLLVAAGCSTSSSPSLSTAQDLQCAVLLVPGCAAPSLTSRMTEADRDRLKAAHWYAYAGTLSQQSIWSNVRSGLGGTVRSLRESCDAGSSDCAPDISRCRDFEQDTSSTDGLVEKRTGRACLRTDGSLAIHFDPAGRL